MDNLIYIWAINRLLGFCYNLMPAFGISATISVLVFIFTLIGSNIEEGKDKAICTGFLRPVKVWMICSIVFGFLFGILGTFKLDKTEFKTVAVYLIGKEVVESNRGEKIISVIDTKLDEWIKKIEK